MSLWNKWHFCKLDSAPAVVVPQICKYSVCRLGFDACCRVPHCLPVILGIVNEFIRRLQLQADTTLISKCITLRSHTSAENRMKYITMTTLSMALVDAYSRTTLLSVIGIRSSYTPKVSDRPTSARECPNTHICPFHLTAVLLANDSHKETPPGLDHTWCPRRNRHLRKDLDASTHSLLHSLCPWVWHRDLLRGWFRQLEHTKKRGSTQRYRRATTSTQQQPACPHAPCSICPVGFAHPRSTCSNQGVHSGPQRRSFPPTRWPSHTLLLVTCTTARSDGNEFKAHPRHLCQVNQRHLC